LTFDRRCRNKNTVDLQNENEFKSETGCQVAKSILAISIKIN